MIQSLNNKIRKRKIHLKSKKKFKVKERKVQNKQKKKKFKDHLQKSTSQMSILNQNLYLKIMKWGNKQVKRIAWMKLKRYIAQFQSINDHQARRKIYSKYIHNLLHQIQMRKYLRMLMFQVKLIVLKRMNYWWNLSLKTLLETLRR